MGKTTKWLSVAFVSLLPVVSFSSLSPFTSEDCAVLAMPKTVLLVYASWCPESRSFLPTYEQVSNQEKYKDWVFYQMTNDTFEKVCGVEIKSVPTTFKNNMKKALVGDRPPFMVEQFLDNLG